MPCFNRICPKYSTLDSANRPFSRRHQSLLSVRRLKSFLRFCKCSSAFDQPTRMLSKYIATLRRPSVRSFLTFWKIPGAEVIRKGSTFCSSTPRCLMSTNRSRLVETIWFGYMRQPSQSWWIRFGRFGIRSDRFGIRSGRFGLSRFSLSRFGLAVSVWPFRSGLFRSGRFGLAISVSRQFGQTMKSCRNLTCSLFYANVLKSTKGFI